MFKTYQLKLCQSKPLSRKIVKFSRECDMIYDMAIMMKLAHPHMEKNNLFNLLSGWREWLNLDGAYFMHEAAIKQAFQSVLKFRAANVKKHERRIRRKKDVRSGKSKKYRHNRWTEPSSLMLRDRTFANLRTVCCRTPPKIKGDDMLGLSKLGTVRIKDPIPDGLMKSFQLKDITRKITKHTTDSDRKFLLMIQVEVPDPEVSQGKCVGMDMGGRYPAATADEYGNERLYAHSGGCARHKGDKIDKLRRDLSKYSRYSSRYKKARRTLKKKSRRISNKQDNDEWMIARSITENVRCLALEEMNLTDMRARGGRHKAGMNRTMAYARPGELRAKTIRMLEKRGGKTHPVDRKNTSIRCAKCLHVDKKSRDGEDFICTMCGWHNHADKNAAKNTLIICFHEEAGGRVHLGGTAITGSDAVERREDHGSDHPLGDPAGRLEPGNNEIVNAVSCVDEGSDRSPKRARFAVVG